METMGKQLKEVAEFLGGSVIGDDSVVICDVRGIDEAGEGDLTFVANPRYRKKLDETGASAVLVSPDVKESTKNLLVVADPYKALAKVLTFFYPEEAEPVGISERAYIEESSWVADDVTVSPGVYVGRNARVGKGTILYPGVVVGSGVIIGENSTLYPNVTIYRGCKIGDRVTIHAGVVIGSDGFGFANPGAENLKVPQVGIVQIDDDVEIGANATIDRGTLGKTWIKKGTKIDNLVQIAHNVVIGENSVIVAQVGISGSTKLGRSVILGGQAGLVGHIEIGDNAMIAARSGVHENVPPNQIVSGSPHMSHRKWLRTQAVISQLPEMRKTLKSLAEKIEECEKKLGKAINQEEESDK